MWFQHASDFRNLAPATFIYQKLGDTGYARANRLMEVCAASSGSGTFTLTAPRTMDWLADELKCSAIDLQETLNVFAEARFIVLSDDAGVQAISIPDLVEAATSVHRMTAANQSRVGGKFSSAPLDAQTVTDITELNAYIWQVAEVAPNVSSSRMAALLNRYSLKDLQANVRYYELHHKGKAAWRKVLTLAEMEIIQQDRLSQEADVRKIQDNWVQRNQQAAAQKAADAERRHKWEVWRDSLRALPLDADLEVDDWVAQNAAPEGYADETAREIAAKQEAWHAWWDENGGR